MSAKVGKREKSLAEHLDTVLFWCLTREYVISRFGPDDWGMSRKDIGGKWISIPSEDVLRLGVEKGYLQGWKIDSANPEYWPSFIGLKRAACQHYGLVDRDTHEVP